MIVQKRFCFPTSIYLDKSRSIKENSTPSESQKDKKLDELYLKISNSQSYTDFGKEKDCLATVEKSISGKFEEGYPIFEELKEFLPSVIGRDKLNNFYSVSQMLKYIKMKQWK